MEKECVVDVLSNPLFTPVPVMEGRLPLSGCVLSVSQFTGAERESLVELAKHLGARYRCPNPRSSFVESLIREPFTL